MPANRIIPSLLLREGRLVKGVRFNGHRDAGAPATTCRAHSAQGADEIIISDIDASRNGKEPDFASLQAISADVQVPITFCGGISDLARARQAMESGADKIGVNTTALDRPLLIEKLAKLLGVQAVVLGVDVMRHDETPVLYDHRSAKPVERLDVKEWVRRAVDHGVGEIRLMSVDREGTRRGLDIPLWAEINDIVDVPIILEGGVGNLNHIATAMQAGVGAVALGTLLVFSDNNLVKVRRFLEGSGLPMRP